MLPENKRRRRFFNHFLMTALHRAFPFAQVNEIAVLVTQHLNLNVPRVFDQFFDVNAAIPEGAQGFARCGFECGSEIFLSIHATHAFASASRDCFEHDGKTGIAYKATASLWKTPLAFLGTGHDRRTTCFRYPACASVFDPIQRNGSRGGADKGESGFFASLRKVRIFAQETITRMNRAHTVTAGGIQNPVDSQVTFQKKEMPLYKLLRRPCERAARRDPHRSKRPQSGYPSRATCG